ncbi:MAG: helix-turn-helix transcriptional regulator [Bacteroidetes bacterium]|nr:helix-turn-helix transcriptional regulator [Bacteroidota bacterium]
MLNLLSAIKESNRFSKIEVNSLLFAEFTCMEEETKFGIWSDNNYFAFISSGKKMWRTIRGSYVVEEGDILFIKRGANLTHQFFDDEFCAVFMFIPDDFILDFIKKYDPLIYARAKDAVGQDAVLVVHPDELLRNYHESIRSYLSLSQKPPEQLLLLKFEELLMSLFANAAHRELTDYFLSLRQPQEYQMTRIMEANFAYNLKLENYAELCNMSLSTFKRYFKQYFRVSPATWLKNKKLDLALHKLTTTDLSITDLSFECGFEDTSHFIRVFKERHGQTPLRYRQVHSKAEL